MPRRTRRFISDPQRPRDPKPRDPLQHVLLVGVALLFYVALLWFGIRVVGDTVGRSLIISALIVIIAGVGYWFTHQEPPARR